MKLNNIFILLAFYVIQETKCLLNNQYCPISYKSILQSLVENIELESCQSYITIFDYCLTETINTIKNNQQKPFEPYVLLNDEDKVQNVQFLLRQDFEYLTPDAAQVFFACMMRKDSIYKGGNVPLPPPPYSPTPVPPQRPPSPGPIPSPSPSPVPSPGPIPSPSPSPVPSPQIDDNPDDPFGQDGSAVPPINRDTIEEVSCENYAEIEDPPLLYSNNQWGLAKTPFPPTQCLLEALGTETPPQVYYGWTWEYGGFDQGIFAYPEVMYGDKPWSNMASTDPDFNKKIKDFNSLAVHIEFEMYNLNGAYNLALELWTTDILKPSNAAIIDNIKTEIMWIIDIDGSLLPGGDIIRTGINIDNIGWNLYQLARDDTGVFWDFKTFATPQMLCEKTSFNSKICKITINIKKYMDYLVQNNLANGEEYISVVEIGNEIAGNRFGGVGTGTSFVKKFDVVYS